MKIVYIELRRLTSNRKSDNELEFLNTRYQRLSMAGFLPTSFNPDDYEDTRHLIVGGWVNALHYHLNEYKSSVVFITSEDDSFPQLLSEVEGKTIFMISIMSGNFTQALKVIRYLQKEAPETITIVGGVHATVSPEETFQVLKPDYLLSGEADSIIKDLIKSIFKDKIFTCDGLWSKISGPPKKKRITAGVNNFEISWDLHNKYSIGVNKEIVNYVNTRSCPFNCHFCGIVKTKHEEMNPDKVASQLSKLREEYDKLWVHWETPCCFNDQKIAERIFERIKDLNIHFAGQTRVEYPTTEKKKLYHLAVNAGLDNLFLGIESMQDNVLKYMNKKNTSKYVEPFLYALKDEGITVNSGWIIGIPGQTEDDVKRDIDAAINLIEKGIMAVALPQYLEIYPGSYYWENATKLGIELNKDIYSYANISKEITHNTRELSKDKIWELYCIFLTAIKSVVKK